MKKIFIIIFLTNFIINIYSSESVEIGIYVPSIDEINYLFTMVDHFNILENTTDISDKDKNIFFDLYKKSISVNQINPLFFQSFLRTTNNTKIKNIIKDFIKENNYNDEYSKILLRLYNSKKEKVSVNNNQTIYQYNYNNEYYDEDINYFFIKETRFFNNELDHMLFTNNWEVFQLNNKNMESIIYNCGGQTNAINIIFKKYNNVSLIKFKELEIDNNILKNSYKNWKIIELPIEGILTYSHTKNIYLGLGALNENDNYTQFNICLFLYSDKYKNGYSINYFINFSKLNNNYSIINKIFNQILLNIMISYINIKD